ncbi:MAG: DegV family protein [Clostridia bacterium]|nr:DegV family protein [Clostridia bacterium]MBQ9997596.1 DegV family protein [Clostridia bacterium]
MYKIITDCGADLPSWVQDQFGVEILPFTVTCDGESKKSSDIPPKELMDAMRAGKSFKTSQINVSEFEDAFTPYAKNNESVIYIAFSSGLSGTYNSACIASEQIKEQYPDFDITVIDTKCASVGFGLVVYKALLMQKDGATKEEVIAKTIENSENMEHIFTVDDLEYLFRGGRVSRTSAILGSILGIKPVLDVDEEGRLRPISKVRGRKFSIKRLAEVAGERGYDLDKQLIGICHGDDMEAATQLKQYMTDMYGCKDFFINEIGATIGSHSGPGTLAVFFLSK